jgi:DNA-binding SARP family transcriptional activator
MGEDERRALRITLLGDVTITLPDGQPAGPWERPVARHLVLMLALAPGHQLARERVSDTLFPKLAPERAAHALSKALTLARTALHERTTGDSILDASRAIVRICPDVEVLVDLDVRRQSLAAATSKPASERRTALTALRDTPWDVATSEPNAEWLDDVREEIRRLHRDVLVTFAESADDAAAEAAWEDVLATDPTDERAAAELIRRQLDSGARDRAHRTYERTRKALRDTLQIEPSPELTELLGAGESAVSAPTGRSQLLDRLLRGALDAFAVLTDEHSTALRPDAVTAWATIAEIHLDHNDSTAAREAARVAIALAGTDAERATA